MEKKQNPPGNQQQGTMLNQKTNEDFNKNKPNPSDPNEQRGHPATTVPDFGDDDIEPMEDQVTKATDKSADKKNVPNKSDGSE